MLVSHLLRGVLIVGLAACAEDAGPAAPAPTPTATVTATPAIRFEPPVVRIQEGGAVTWLFEAVPHNVFFTGGPVPPADIAGLNQSTAASRTFPTAGTYDYECRIHPGMTGQVVVVASSTGPY